MRHIRIRRPHRATGRSAGSPAGPRVHPRPRVVIVGAGFAGVHAARSLVRFTDGAADVVLINPTDYFLYLPLLPEVAAGMLDPRRVAVSLRTACPGVRLRARRGVTGSTCDDRGRRLSGPGGRRRPAGYDRLLLAAGSVNKLLPIPGVAEYAHGFRSIAEALYLRDHLIRQIELADGTEDGGRAGRPLHLRGGGRGLHRHRGGRARPAAHRDWSRGAAGLRGQPIALDAARPRPAGAARAASAAVRHRRPGADAGAASRCGRGTSVEEATADGVRLTDGESCPTRTLIWCVGVRPDPLVEQLGLPTAQGGWSSTST